MPSTLIFAERLAFEDSFRIRTVPHLCTLIPGDGIGPEVAQKTIRAVEATGVDIRWQRVELNESIILESGKTLPRYVLDSLNEQK